MSDITTVILPNLILATMVLKTFPKVAGLVSFLHLLVDGWCRANHFGMAPSRPKAKIILGELRISLVTKPNAEIVAPAIGPRVGEVS